MDYFEAILPVFQKLWIAETLLPIARVGSLAVVVGGVAMVVFVTVVTAREVVPVITTPGTWNYTGLQLLLTVLSFLILFNYICCVTFSLRIGRGPGAASRPRAKSSPVCEHLAGTENAVKPDGKRAETRQRTALTEEDMDDEFLLDGEALLADVNEAVTENVFQLHSGTASMGDGRNTQPRFGAFPSSPPPPPPSARSNPHTAVAVPGATSAEATLSTRSGGGALPSPSSSPSVPGIANGLGGATMTSTEASSSSGGPNALMGTVPRRAAAKTGSSANPTTSLLHPFTSSSASPSVSPAGKRGDVPQPQCCLRAARRFATCVKHPERCGARSAGRPAPPTILSEIERIAMEGETYTATQRRYKLLDPPRRYCRVCGRFKAPREHHCSICNECVPRMDHHCPWINSCVDAENQRYFTSFVVWLWLGTLLDASFLGYTYTKQSHFEKEWKQWQKAWRQSRAVDTTLTAFSTPPPVAPYGPSGHKLVSFPVVMTVTLSAVICLCMCVFLYQAVRQLLRNTTPIESFLIEDKQQNVFQSTSFVYRSPYDLGWWRNVVEVFATADDPLVAAAVRASRVMQARQAFALDRYAMGATQWKQRVTEVAKNVAFLVWLVTVPTMRPTGCDGVHYATFDSELEAAPLVDTDREMV